MLPGSFSGVVSASAAKLIDKLSDIATINLNI
jgi:hypothetical protein